MLRRLGLVCVSIVAAALIVLLGIRLWPRQTPQGQPPLVRLSSIEPIRQAFNAATDRTRVVALLSPTCGTCIAGATELGRRLATRSTVPVTTLVVWMPVILTDIAAPTSARLALIADARAQQFWDPDHLVSTAILSLAHQHVDRLSADQRDLLEGAPVAWDLVASFPPGVQWASELPWPSFWGFPVVGAVDDLVAPWSPG